MKPASESELQYISSKSFGHSGYRIHRIDGGNGWSYPKHTHDGYCEFVCCSKGELDQNINGRDFHQVRGQVILIREKDYHSLAGKGFVYTNVMFPLDWFTRIESYFSQSGISESILNQEFSPSFIVQPSEWPEYERMLDDLINKNSRNEGRGTFCEFMAWIFSRYFIPQQSTASAKQDWPEWVKQAVQRVDRTHENFPSLSDLVKDSCRCHEHFTRQFARFVGMTPTDYLISKRVERAAELLVMTNSKVSHIASTTGFENESYFFRTFRKLKGMSPLAYRVKYGSASLSR